MVVDSRKPRGGPLDIVLGGRIKRLRRELGMTQTGLGEALGITFQQVQKYENGANRISALMLLKLADALGVTVGDLLHDLDPAIESQIASTPGASKLLSDFGRIRSDKHRELVLNLAASLAVLGE